MRNKSLVLLISRATQKQAIIHGKHVYHFLFLQWLFFKSVVLPERWACSFYVKSIKRLKASVTLIWQVTKKYDSIILRECRNTSVTCSDLSIAKMAWNHQRGACFFLVSLKSLRINHHYRMSFVEDTLYRPIVSSCLF